MSRLHDQSPHSGFAWDKDHTRIALAVSRHHASRRGRRARLQAADREDLRQDALLALVARAHGFEGSQSGWVTFADLVVRHALFDRAASQQAATAHIVIGLALDDLPGAASEDPSAGIVTGIDLERAWPALQPHLQRVLVLVAEEGSLADACRASAMPSTAFYRVIADLRLWLEAAGLGPRGKKRGVGR